MITTKVKIVKLFPVLESKSWFTAFLFVEVSEHIEGGNQIGCKSGMYHKSFWMKEFNLTEDELNKLIVK